MFWCYVNLVTPGLAGLLKPGVLRLMRLMICKLIIIGDSVKRASASSDT